MGVRHGQESSDECGPDATCRRRATALRESACASPARVGGNVRRTTVRVDFGEMVSENASEREQIVESRDGAVGSGHQGAKAHVCMCARGQRPDERRSRLECKQEEHDA